MLSLIAQLDPNEGAPVPITWWSLIGFAIPILTAVVARYRDSNSAVHAVVAIAASAVVAALQSLVDDIPQDTFPSVVAVFLGVFIPAIASYIGFWKPVADINRKIAPDKGL